LITFTLILTLLSAVPDSANLDVTFCAAGDVLLDRGVRKYIDRYGVNYPFEQLSDLINSHDLAFCNLECPISSWGEPLTKKIVFRGDSSYVEGLTFSGFDIFSLANNHTIDYGREALLNTRAILEGNGLHTVGIGENQTVAGAPQIITIKGMRIAFFAHVLMPHESIVYSHDLPAPAIADIDSIVENVREIEDKVDFTIVSFHWGREYSPYPSYIQKEHAYRSIDAGADLILGHHPHVIQSIEKYQGKYIFYSLGNFVFDQDRLDGSQSFLLSTIFKDRQLEAVTLIPIKIERCQPRLATGIDFREIFEQLIEISPGVNFEINEQDSGMEPNIILVKKL